MEFELEPRMYELICKKHIIIILAAASVRAFFAFNHYLFATVLLLYYGRFLDVSFLAGISLDPIALVAALLRTEKEMLQLHSRLKLSSQERDMGVFIIANREDKIHPVRPAVFVC